MSNRNYVKGRNFEYQIRNELEDKGYYCLRSAGSHSKIDIFAILTKEKTEQPLFLAIQAKVGSSPYQKDLTALKKLNLPKSVQKEIWIKKDRTVNRIRV